MKVIKRDLSKDFKNINIFDLSEYECKAILLYVYLNLFSNGLALGIDNSKKYMKIKN